MVLTSGVRERVLVLAGRELWCQSVEPLFDGRPFRAVDEDVPVQAADDVVLVLVTGDSERGSVDVLDAPVGADDGEQARHGVRHGVEEIDLRAQLGLKTVAAQHQACGGGHGIEKLRLVVERGVVGDRRDPVAVLLDDLHGSTRARLGLRHSVTLRVDPTAARRSLTLVEPVQDGKLVVAQCARERIP